MRLYFLVFPYLWNMTQNLKRILLGTGLFLLLAAALPAQTRQETEAFKATVEADLYGNILPFWSRFAPDTKDGFYGTILTDGTSVPDAERGAVLNARILWTFSNAYRHRPAVEYKQLADRAAAYYIGHFIDWRSGGVFWTLDADGYPADRTLQTYAAAFGIYGLSEHFRATGDQASLTAAIGIYRALEDQVHDKVLDGYFDTFAQEGKTGVDGKKGAEKTMNTHIHVLEAYTNLYRVWPDPELRGNLAGLIGILQTRLYDAKTKHLVIYCDARWNPIGNPVSYGHDIEASWLLTEAAEVLGDEQLLAAVRKQAVEMVDVALAEGIDATGVMLNGIGEENADPLLEWWPQAEAVVGCINAWQLTGKESYFRAAQRSWAYIKNHCIDYENGGWFKKFTPDGKPAHAPKGSLWNCPYHNSRMGSELSDRLIFPAVDSEVMAWSNLTGIRKEGELVDFESSLRIGIPGGNIEASGREKQSGVRFTREGNRRMTVTPMHGATVSQTVTDVDSRSVRLDWTVQARETLPEGVFFCLSFDPRHYGNATFLTTGKTVSVTAPTRSIRLRFDRSVKPVIRDEGGNKVVYCTLTPRLKKDTEVQCSAVMEVDCVPDHEPLRISIDRNRPGREFAGMGGNFRIQNVQKDPEVIDYCLENMRVAYGRVEFPWARWDKDGAKDDHVIRSAEMARRLGREGMPVIVSCWFPPEWAGRLTTRSDGTARAYSLLPEQKDRIFASMAGYLEFLKQDYGVEADFFSFNESDLGIDIVHTPEEHRDFIKEFGAYLAGKGLKTRLLLGDNSDATTFDFILPAMADPAAHKYIGAVSFHSWRGCDDATLAKWAGAARQLNVPLLVAEGSTDAAAHRYPAIFAESTFAFYEINLYVRLCALCQPLSILQWQLTSDYSLLLGDGIFGTEGPLRPTQRFFNIRQLGMTPEHSFVIPASASKADINCVAYTKPATGECAVHIVNNAGACEAEISGFPAEAVTATVYTTNHRQNSEAACYPVKEGKVVIPLPASSFVTILTE